MPVAGMQAPTKGGRGQPVTASRGRTGPPRHPVLSAIQPRKGVASVGRSVLGDVFRRSHGESNRSNRRVVAGPYHPQSARALVGERRSPRLICAPDASMSVGVLSRPTLRKCHRTTSQSSAHITGSLDHAHCDNAAPLTDRLGVCCGDNRTSRRQFPLLFWT